MRFSIKFVVTILFLLCAGFSFAAEYNFSINKFGAKGDGKTMDTAAINKAIDACENAGGGTVYFPPGIYLSGSIH